MIGNLFRIKQCVGLDGGISAMIMSRSGFSKGLDLFAWVSLLMGFFASDGQYRNWN